MLDCNAYFIILFNVLLWMQYAWPVLIFITDFV